LNGKLKFEGEYLNGKRNGQGKEYYDNDKLEYEGEYINGKRSGKGKEFHFNGKLKFDGEYLNGKKLIGIIYDENGNFSKTLTKRYYYNKIYNWFGIGFEGEFLNGEKNGEGREYYGNGQLEFFGEYLNGEKVEKVKNIIEMVN